MSSSGLDPATLHAPAVFADTAAHLGVELAWLHRLVGSEVRLASHGVQSGAVNEFAGLYISREEIERDLDGGALSPAERDERDAALRTVRAPADRLRADLDVRIAASLAAGIDLRLERLARSFGLGQEQRLAVLCCSAVELDARFSRLFAYLQNDVSRRRPTINLLARLSGGGAVDGMGIRRALAPDCALFRHHLLEKSSAGDDQAYPLWELRAAASVVDFLLGADRPDPSIAAFADLIVPAPLPGSLRYYQHHRDILERLLRQRGVGAPLPPVYLAGAPGAGTTRIAEAFAEATGRRLLTVDTPSLLAASRPLDGPGRILVRDAVLHDAVICLDRVDAGCGEGEEGALRDRTLTDILRWSNGCDIALAGSEPPAKMHRRLGVPVQSFTVPLPTYAERLEIWRQHLAPAAPVEAHEGAADLAGKFRFTPAQIAEAVKLTRSATPGGRAISLTDLHARCRALSNQAMGEHCQRIEPKYTWDDIVLPSDTAAQLHEICRCIRFRPTVLELWGYGDKLSLGKGLTVLFSGASGTGKTMSAEVIANDLHLDLYKIDISRVVSKYVGETEKNLSRIFDEGENSNAILLFDEADAIFGKRSEVKDAHDRYANIEINYLLQRIDHYEGIVILSTNMKGNLDGAFIRRLAYIVEYPMPQEPQREMIWRKSFPQQTPMSPDIDFPFLARQLPLSGGNIKNISLNSAFMASADGAPISMLHIVRATKREFQKLGRFCTRSDFGRYYSLVREGDE